MSNRLGQPLIGIFRGTVPVTLFRLQSAKAVSLRDFDVAAAAGKKSWDVRLHAGRVEPSDLSGSVFMGPNGMSLRPVGAVLATLVAGFRGRCNVFEVPAGTPIPAELVLLHEHSDLFALQAARSMPLAELNKRLTAFLGQPGVVVSSRDAFYKAHPDMLPEAVGFSENA